MRDPFRNQKRTQLIREAQIGLSVVAIMLVLFAYVAFHRIMGHGYHLPEHVRNAPLARTVVPPQKNFPGQPAPRQMATNERLLTPSEFLEKANRASQQKTTPSSNIDDQMATLKRRTHKLANEKLSGFGPSNPAKFNDPKIESTLTSRPLDTAAASTNFEPKSFEPLATNTQPAESKPSVISMLESLKLPDTASPVRTNPIEESVGQSINQPTQNQIGGSFKVQVVPSEQADSANEFALTKPETESQIADDPFANPAENKLKAPLFVNDLRSDNSAATKPEVITPAGFSGSTGINDPKVNSNFVANDLAPRVENFSDTTQADPIQAGLTRAEKNGFQPAIALANAEVDLPKVEPTNFQSIAAPPTFLKTPPSSEGGFAPQAQSFVQSNSMQTPEQGDFTSPVMTSSRPTNSMEQDEGYDSNLGFREPTEINRESESSIENAVVVSGTGADESRTYVIKEGDSFWSIAQDKYGDGRFFRVLFKYNEPTVVKFDNLVAGTKIGTPSVSDLFKLWPELCPKADSEQVAGLLGTKSDASQRLYVTNEGDTLFEIARQRLGQASRYFEILKMNDLRLDGSVSAATPLRAGIRLVLPSE